MWCWTLHLNRGQKILDDVAVAVQHKVYSFVGHGYSKQIDVYIFNTVTLSWTKLPAVMAGRGKRPLEVPSRRQGHTAVLIGHTVYILGGCCDSDWLYAFDVDAHRWLNLSFSGTVPAGRTFHSACVLGKVMYIYGGHTNNLSFTNDIYKLDTNTMVWSLINTRGITPPASVCHSATIIGTKMFVFGARGYGLPDDGNTIRVFDTETNCWLNTPPAQFLPDVRFHHSAFAYNGELYIFGGHYYSNNELLKFNPETYSWKKVVPPTGKGPSATNSMCCCLVGDRVVLFGGNNGITCNLYAHDLYILDLSPSLKTLSKVAVIQYGMDYVGLPHNVRWEITAMTIPTETN